MENPQYDYAVIGGDMRSVYLTEELAHHQNRICHYALMAAPDENRCSDAAILTAVSSLAEACTSSRCIICPIPFSKNGCDISQNVLNENLALEELLSVLHHGQSFFAGCIPETFKKEAEEKGVFVHDLMLDTVLVYHNTIATAEGALCEAISRSPLNLHKSSCAVLGFGKCGSTLAQYLKGMFCSVYVSTNDNEERAKASIIADDTGDLNDFKKKSEQFDFIFNTIPAPVINSETLQTMQNGVTIIDIASAPGGVDFAESKRLGITAILCPGLPGKYAPSSSARLIKDTVEAHMNVYP